MSWIFRLYKNQQTFEARQFGEHVHVEDREEKRGRIFTVRQEEVAAMCVEQRGSGCETNDVFNALEIAGFRKESLPYFNQVSQWLSRQKGPDVVTKEAEKTLVVEINVEWDKYKAWDLDKESYNQYSDSSLFALPSSAVISGTEVYLCITCKRMLERLRFVAGSGIIIGTDAKMSLFNGGWKMCSIGLLVKGAIGKTNLKRGADGTRIEATMATTKFVPIMQGIAHQETRKTYGSFFKDFIDLATLLFDREDEDTWATAVRQLHKDLRREIEDARMDQFPDSRPCDDRPHASNKWDKQIPKKCKVLKENADGVLTKELFYAPVIIGALKTSRFLPTVDIFSALWFPYMDFLKVEESAVPEYLMDDKSKYFFVASREHLEQKLGMIPRPYCADNFMFSGTWDGVFGTYPGFACGNQPTESFHSMWETRLHNIGKQKNVLKMLDKMQELYEIWCNKVDTLNNKMEISTNINWDPIPDNLNGTALRRSGRSPAVDYFHSSDCGNHLIISDDANTTIVAMSNRKGNAASPAQRALNIADAKLGAALLNLGGTLLCEKLKEGGLLYIDPETATTNVSWSRVGEVFDQICYVVGGQMVNVAYPAFRKPVCTCKGFGMSQQCEHVLFARSLKLPMLGRPLAFERVPTERRRGRPRKNAER